MVKWKVVATKLALEFDHFPTNENFLSDFFE